ncbi:MAG: acetylglucosamine-6-sulfatase, partial [Bacteroidales bacterium]|nr:acetylglucosamine-6-sulfatase [Bacteroidales bacterium]
LAREDGLISSKSPGLTGSLMAELGFSDTTQRIRDIVDWPPAQKDTGWKLATPEGERDGYEMAEINTVVNSFHYHNLVLMSELARKLGREDESKWFSDRALKVREAVNTKLFNHATGRYVDGEGSEHSSVHANMFPLAFGLVPEENVKSVVQFVKSRGMACSVYGAQFLLEGLYEAGEAEYAFSLLTSTTDRSWYNMINAGSTITLEAWDIKYKPNLDWNHAWGAAPANIIVRNMWGIKPLAPGFEKAVIKPQMAGLKYSEITAPTIKGPVHGRYIKSKKGTETYFFSIPDGISETLLSLPPGYDKVMINGDRQGAGTPEMRLQPGDYIIELVKTNRPREGL